MHQTIQNNDPDASVRFHNGAVFVARRVTDIPLVSIAALVNVGAYHDTILGIAHFFEHLAFAKTKHFQDAQILHFFAERGGRVNAYVTSDQTVFYGDVSREHFRDGIAGIAELVCSDVFEQKRIMDEALTITTEWASREMRPGGNRFSQALKATLGRNVPPPLIGTPESIASITQTDIEDFYAQHFTMDNLVVYIEGDMDPEVLLDRAVNEFTLGRGKTNPLGPLLPFCPATVNVELPHLVATHASLLFPSHSATVPGLTKVAGNLCQAMLLASDGDLMRELRHDKRLVYGVAADGVRNSRIALDTIGFDAFPGNVPQICEIIMRHVTDMGNAPNRALFDRVLKKNRSAAEADMRINREHDAGDVACIIQQTGRVPAHDGHVRSLQKVTIEDVALYATTYWGGKDVSVFYEGVVEPDFPDHIALARSRSPVRTQQVTRRVMQPFGVESRDRALV